MKTLLTCLMIFSVGILYAAPRNNFPSGNRIVFRDPRGRISGTALRFGEQVIVRDANGNIGGRVVRFGDKETFINPDGKVYGSIEKSGQWIIQRNEQGEISHIAEAPATVKIDVSPPESSSRK